jgi:hypothetical protein
MRVIMKFPIEENHHKNKIKQTKMMIMKIIQIVLIINYKMNNLIAKVIIEML